MGDEAKLTPLGKLVIGLFLAGCIAGGLYFIFKGKPQATGQQTQTASGGAKPAIDDSRPAVEIGG